MSTVSTKKSTRADKRAFHYIYKITRKSDGFYYIGMHSTNDLSDNYFGSGLRIKRSVAKYGADAHTKEIIEYCETRKLLCEREKELVTTEMLLDEKCLNLKVGGAGGWDHVDIRGDKHHMHRPEVKERVAAGVKASYTPARRESYSISMASKWVNGTIKPRTGWVHSEAARSKISFVQAGRKLGARPATSQEEIIHRRELANKRIAKMRDNGFDFGASLRGKPQPISTCPHCGMRGGISNMTRYHFDNCKHHPENTHSIKICPHCSRECLREREVLVHFENCRSNPNNPAVIEAKLKNTCPHCNRVGRGKAFRERHFENCRTNARRSKPKTEPRKNAPQPNITCNVCGLNGAAGNMLRYHFEKCKHKIK